MTVNAVVIFTITRLSDSTSVPTSKARVTTITDITSLPLPVHAHLSPVKGVFPGLRTKKRRPNTAETLTQPYDEEPSLSKIGDFAATRDDGTRSNGLISMIREASRPGQKRDLLTPSSLSTSEFQYQMQNVRQMGQTGPRLKRSGLENQRSSNSLDDLKEEVDSPPGSHNTPFSNGILEKVDDNASLTTDETSKPDSVERLSSIKVRLGQGGRLPF